MEATLVLGNQLFPLKYQKKLKGTRFMAESHELCTHFKYHKHKILFFLMSMRRYRDELKESGIKVHYEELPKKNISYLELLEKFLKKNKVKTLHAYEIEDHFFAEKIDSLCLKLKVSLKIHDSPMFLVKRSQFSDYLNSTKKPFMKTFYERLRKERSILMDDSAPVEGKFSFDGDNRNKLPKKCDPPPLHWPPPDQTPYFKEIKSLVEEHFPKHPGKCDDFWLATNRKEAKKVFKRFLDERLEGFGTYQDAITNRSDFVFHSIISPYINMGLLLPDEVIDQVEKSYRDGKCPINSAEGFIRQVLGWREFVRGIYQNFDKQQQQSNFFNHKRKLTKHWYEGTTGVPPVDDAIKKAVRFGYNHHIERLMVLSNLMLLCEIDPKEVFRWFMEMYVDSSDWVMGPNVFGMGQFSDGGIFATKPYICGSNYLIKMSDYKKDDWCDGMDGLYWRFISNNREFFSKNPRLSMMTRTLDKIDKKRLDHIFQEADNLLEKITKI